MSKMAAILKYFKPHLLPNSVRFSGNLMEGIEVTGRFRNAELFSSSIQDGNHVGNLETLWTTSDSEMLKAIGSDSEDGHHGTM